MLETTIDDVFNKIELSAICVSRVRKQFPDSKFLELVQKESKDLKQSTDKIIQKYRNEYNKISSFKERDVYMKNTLSHMESAYKKMSDELSQKPKLYESWFNADVYKKMKVNGFRNMVVYYMSTGLIYENK